MSMKTKWRNLLVSGTPNFPKANTLNMFGNNSNEHTLNSEFDKFFQSTIILFL